MEEKQTKIKDHLFITYMECALKKNYNFTLISLLVDNKTLAQKRAFTSIEFLFFLPVHTDKWEL